MSANRHDFVYAIVIPILAGNVIVRLDGFWIAISVWVTFFAVCWHFVPSLDDLSQFDNIWPLNDILMIHCDMW